MEQDKDLAFLAGGGANRHHSTKRNPGPKLHVGEAGAAPGEGEVPVDGEDYYLEEIPTSAGRPTDSRLDREARAAQRIGIPTNEGAHLPSTLAGSLASRSQSEGQDTSQTGGAHSPLALPAFKAKVEDLLREFFLEQDYGEARLAFNELMASAPFFAFEFVARTIRRALEKTDADREAACRLLSTLSRRPAGIHTPALGATAPPISPPGLSLASARTPPASPPPAHVLSQAAMGQGVERVLEMLDDVVKDVPRARALMARLVARAVADEILPPGARHHCVCVHALFAHSSLSRRLP
jgi:hypothetical protein